MTVGEVLGLFAQTRPGVLHSGAGFDFRVAGAEFNVAIGLARLDVPAAWVGRVGRDPLGAEVLRVLRGERVEVYAPVDDSRATGLMVKHRRTSTHQSVTYFRSGSAGSTLDRDDLPHEVLAGADIVHTTGITLALSSSAADAAEEALSIGRRGGARASLDVNYRSRLWSPHDARRRINRLLSQVDVLFASADEAALLLEEDLDPLLAARRLQAAGPADVIIKLGDQGAVAVTGDDEASAPAVAVPVLDTVGAGDAFVAGYLAGSTWSRTLAERLRLACATGAFACTSDGDWEGAATLDDLGLLSSTDPVSR